MAEAVEGDKARSSSGDFVVLVWTWMRVWARRRDRSYSLEAVMKEARKYDQISEGAKRTSEVLTTTLTFCPGPGRT